MASYLFDTDSMREAAQGMGSAAGDLMGRIVGLSPAGVLMPPSLEVDTAEVITGAAADLTESAAFYGANAINLAQRTLLVLAENGATGIGARLESLTVELRSVFGRAIGRDGLLHGNPISVEQVFSDLETGVDSHVAGWFGDGITLLQTTIDVIAGDSRLIVSMGDVALDIARNPVFEAGSRIAGGLGIIAVPFDVVASLKSTEGDSLAAREFNVAATAEGDLAKMLPEVAGANVLSAGAVNTDIRFITDMGTGLVEGGWHGLNVSLNQDANLVAEGKLGGPVVHGLSDAVNWAVDESYAPVSHLISEVGQSVSPVSNAAGHLAGTTVHVADSAIHDVGSGVDHAEHALGGTVEGVESWL